MMSFKEQILYMKTILRHPIEGFYELRIKGKGAIGASLIFLCVFLCQIAVMYITNFVFNPYKIDEIRLSSVASTIYLPIVIWIIASFLVTSIMKGHGTLKNIFVATGYSFTPFILFSIPLAVLSLVFTRAEESIYIFLRNGIYIWVAILFYFQVKETHDFDVFEAVKVVFWTLFAMLMIFVFAAALIGISSQSFNIIREIITEAFGNV